ncbi:hypothetical protein FB45DRAFT_997856 [Roridomyces roridus]|uniref:MYND-type domain-containing protein n=1 Tax=Roridomyces roridus TaxID=1738132 RepID=A0AAD7CNB1_9AGAR|nr:hypothetical protein FB45DRAFT_997856 [Roridomyces roridus]
MSRAFWAIASTVTAVVTTATDAVYSALSDPSPVLDAGPPIEHTPSEEPERAAEDDSEEAPRENTPSPLRFECDWCGANLTEPPAYECPGCTERYCSPSCLEQSADWHVRRCANPCRPLTTADHLATATFNDLFPDDPQTNEDYFFTRVRTPHDKTMLFGLYIGILKYHNVKPSTLHEWRISGTMVENIKALYEPTPVQARGLYYPWFLKHLDVFEPSPTALVSVSIPARHLCASCGVSAGVRCAGCKRVWYCSQKCQKDDWSGHLVDCYAISGRSITSAEHLRAAIHRRRLPDDLGILAEFGFTRVDDRGKAVLQEVYRVVFDEGIRPRELMGWQRAGNLYPELKALLDRLHFGKTYNIISWFNENQHTFDPSAPAPEPGISDAAKIRAAMVALWQRVGDVPSQNAEEILSIIGKTWPQTKADVFRFISSLQVCHPGPDLEYWVNFGFCACQDEEEERFLSQTYRMLTDWCSFDAFFNAYRTSKLADLFDAHNLRGRRIIHPYLEDVLSRSPILFKSVWDLKQHVLATQATRAHLIPSVNADYGFAYCASDSEYHDLRNLYRDIFERRDANPLKLHEACVSGKLYEYVLGLFPELAKKKNRAKKFQRLLRNVYPLPEPRPQLKISGVSVGDISGMTVNSPMTIRL